MSHSQVWLLGSAGPPKFAAGVRDKPARSDDTHEKGWVRSGLENLPGVQIRDSSRGEVNLD